MRTQNPSLMHQKIDCSLLLGNEWFETGKENSDFSWQQVLNLSWVCISFPPSPLSPLRIFLYLSAGIIKQIVIFFSPQKVLQLLIILNLLFSSPWRIPYNIKVILIAYSKFCNHKWHICYPTYKKSQAWPAFLTSWKPTSKYNNFLLLNSKGLTKTKPT